MSSWFVKRQAVWVRLTASLAALLLTACSSAPLPPEVKTPKPKPEVGVRAQQLDFTVRDKAGRSAWRLRGKARSRLGQQGSQLALLDATADMVDAPHPVTARAGRISYQSDRRQIVFDRRVYVAAPDQRISLETEAAVGNTTTREFIAKQPVRARYGAAVLDAQTMRVAADLRRGEAWQLVARWADGPSAWTGQAAKATVDEARCVRLSRLHGRLEKAGSAVEFTADTAVWNPSARELRIGPGGQVTRDDLTITATDELVWRPDTGLVTTAGAVRAEQRELRASGTGAVVDVVRRTATLQQVQADAKGAHLTAARATLAADRTVTAHGVSGQVNHGKVHVAAPLATYRPDQQVLVLPQGGTATQAKTRVRCGRATLDSKQNHFEVTGGVSVADGDKHLSGDRLSGPADLTSATLTPVRASGRSKRGAWSLQADSGRWQREGPVRLHAARGTFTTAQRQAQGKAAEATIEPKSKRLTFTGGFELHSPSDGAEVRADRAVYEPQPQVFIADGHVQAKVRGIAVHNRQWRYYFGREASGQLGESGAAARRRSAAKKEPAGSERNRR